MKLRRAGRAKDSFWRCVAVPKYLGEQDNGLASILILNNSIKPAAEYSYYSRLSSDTAAFNG